MTNPINKAASAMPIAELRAVNKSFITAGGHELKVLEQIDLAVQRANYLPCLANQDRANPPSCAA